jgi:histidinol-phosphate aminotransferase
MMGADVTLVGESTASVRCCGLEQALSMPAKMVIFSNPSNPVGCMLDKDGFARIIAAAPQDCVLVIDEAYFEYCQDDPDYPDSLAVLARSRARGLCCVLFRKPMVWRGCAWAMA